MKRWLSRGHLNRGGDIRPDEGYTIMETLIVLAVTAAMFSAILVVFNGRQARIEFAQAVRDYEAMLQNIMSDVSKGYYSSDGYKCTLDAAGTPALSPDAANSTGTNGDCIFLGFTLEPQGKTNLVNTLISSRYSSTNNKEENQGLISEMLSGTGNNFTTAKELERNITNSYQLSVIKMIPLVDTSMESKMLVFTNFTGVFTSEEQSRQVSVMAFKDNIIDSSTGKIDKSLFVGPSGDNFLGTSTELLGSKGIAFCLEGQNGQKAEIKLGTEDSSASIFSTLDVQPGELCG